MKCLLFVLLWTSLNVWAEDELKVLTLQHHFASDLLPTIAPLVGENGTATGMNNQLIIRTDTSRMREIESLVLQLDTLRINRKITILSNQNIRLSQTSIDAKTNIKRGNLDISNTTHHENNTVQLNIQNSQSDHSQMTQQFVNVLDGEQAFIRVGEIVPFTQDWIVLTERYVRGFSITDWKEITTGFTVRPRSLGDQIELEITPRFAKRNSFEKIDFNDLSTTVRVSLGDWVDIGSLMLHQDEISHKILGFSNDYSVAGQMLKVKVD
jgi:hypothetical protein